MPDRALHERLESVVVAHSAIIRLPHPGRRTSYYRLDVREFTDAIANFCKLKLIGVFILYPCL